MRNFSINIGSVVMLLLAAARVFGDPDGDKLFQYVQEGDLKKVKELLAKNAKLANVKCSYSGYPLETAASCGYKAIAEELLKAGAKLDIETAAALGKTKEVAAMLKEKPWLAKPPRKPLHDAAGHRHLDIVKLLLDHGADPNLDYGFSNAWPITPLSNAVASGDFEIVKLLCEHGAKLNVAIGKNHDSAFHYAVAYHDAPLVKLLLQHKADPNATDGHGLTPLHVTADLGSIDKAKVLLDFKADINVQTSDGATSLFFAAVLGHRDYCEALLKRGARLDVYSACALGKTAEGVALLKADPKLAKTRDSRLQRTPLFWAARSGDATLVKLLLEQGAEVNLYAAPYSEPGNVVAGPSIWDRNSTGKTGETPLHLAAGEGHVEASRLLLDQGADVNAGDESGRTPLQLACEKHHAKVVELLLKRGAAVMRRDRWGNTPLHAASEDPACIKHLLAAKADINAANEEATTPVRSAAYQGAKEAAELLLLHGAKLDLFGACLLGKTDVARKLLDEEPTRVNLEYSKYGHETPLMLAAKSGHADVVRLLLERGAKYDPAKVPYPSGMHLAAMYGRIEVIQAFLDKGVSVNARSGEVTPLIDAAMCTQLETVRFLLSKKADPKLIAERSYLSCASALHSIGNDRFSSGGPARRERGKADRLRREVEIARLLIKAGADVNAFDDLHGTPLHAAVGRGQLELAAELLAHGARVNARDQYGQTPLRMVRHSQDANGRRMAKLLREKGGVE
jgi:ankyrin repeat protein